MLAAALAALSGCGYVGDIKPPVLDVPQRVADLRGIQYGSKIVVEFTLPPMTTEGLPLVSPKSIDLRVTDGGATENYAVPAKAPGVIRYELPANDWTGKTVAMTVRATGPKNKTSEWSNEWRLSVGAALPVPTGVSAKNDPNGVALAWSAAGGSRYRIYRGSDAQNTSPIGTADSPAYLDTTAQNGVAYRYLVQAVGDASSGGDLRQSEASAVVEITPRDEFPPAVPANVSAVAGVNSIELAWDRNTEADLAAYNVYRADPDSTEFQRIAGSLDAPTFSDRTVEPGKRYRYAVTSTDLVGNESARSPIVDALAQ
jgi:hypothetical protein